MTRWSYPGNTSPEKNKVDAPSRELALHRHTKRTPSSQHPARQVLEVLVVFQVGVVLLVVALLLEARDRRRRRRFRG